MAWFQVDDQLAMHRKVCEAGNAAMGLWVRAGAWSMQNLTEGFVSTKAARTIGTAAQAKSLVDAGLWLVADGGYRFHEWGTRQMSAEQIADRRQKRAEAGRKGGKISKPPPTGKAKLEANAQASASDLLEHLPEQKRTPVPVPVPVPNSVSGYVQESATEGDPRASGVAATPGADLVRAIVPKGHPSATLTSLRIQASELINGGAEHVDVADGLRLWCSKPGVGIGRTILASMVSEVIKSRSSPPRTANGNGHDTKVDDYLAFANQPSQREIEG